MHLKMKIKLVSETCLYLIEFPIIMYLFFKFLIIFISFDSLL